MFDKSITKYIKINDKQIICGQTSQGIWYCKELPCQEINELDALIGEVNIILNKYNKTSNNNNKQKNKNNVPLSKKPKVKGLE